MAEILYGASDIADMFFVEKCTVSNWCKRYEDTPPPDYDAMNTDIVVATELWHSEDERCNGRAQSPNLSTVEWARSLRCEVTGWEGDEEMYDMVIDALAAEIDVLSWLLAEAQWKER